MGAILLKKRTKIFIFVIVLITLLIQATSLATSSKFDALKSINVNDINLNSIDKSKVNELREALNSIDVNKLDSSAVVNTINKNDIKTGNITSNSIDINSINIDEVLNIYEDLSEIVSNEDIADLLKDNSKLLVEAGLDKDAISTSETLLRTFDSSAVVDIVRNDLDLDKLIEMYKNGASLEDIIKSIITGTSTQTKIKIVFTLLFANFYVRVFFVVMIFIAIYSIFVTSLIFSKARKKQIWCNSSSLQRHCSFENMSSIALAFITSIYSCAWLANANGCCNYWKIRTF